MLEYSSESGSIATYVYYVINAMWHNFAVSLAWIWRHCNLLGSGGIEITKWWARSLLNRMGMVKRKACSKNKINPDHFESLKEQFLLDIKQTVELEEIPHELIINWDQTAIHYVPSSSWTMEVEGSKRVDLGGKDDKRQITACFAGTMTGHFLPTQLVYEGKTSKN